MGTFREPDKFIPHLQNPEGRDMKLKWFDTI